LFINKFFTKINSFFSEPKEKKAKKTVADNSDSKKNIQENAGSQKNIAENDGGSKKNIPENTDGNPVLYQRPETQGNHSQSQGKRNKPAQAIKTQEEIVNIIELIKNLP